MGGNHKQLERKEASREVVIWITRLNENESFVRLKVEGQIVGDWVDVLDRECRKHLRGGRQVVLDFFNVTFIDSRGLEVFRRLKADGLKIVSALRFIEEALDGE